MSILHNSHKNQTWWVRKRSKPVTKGGKAYFAKICETVGAIWGDLCTVHVQNCITRTIIKVPRYPSDGSADKCDDKTGTN